MGNELHRNIVARSRNRCYNGQLTISFVHFVCRFFVEVTPLCYRIERHNEFVCFSQTQQYFVILIFCWPCISIYLS